MDDIPAHIIPPIDGQHTSTFIFVHDEGSTGEAFATSFQHFSERFVSRGTLLPRAKLIFLDALIQMAKTTHQLTTAPDSESMRTWFLRKGPHALDETASESQWNQLAIAVLNLDTLIEREARLVGRDRIFICAVGMGFAVAIATLFQLRSPIGAVYGAAVLLPFPKDLEYLATLDQTASGEKAPHLNAENLYKRDRLAEMAQGQTPKQCLGRVAHFLHAKFRGADYQRRKPTDSQTRVALAYREGYGFAQVDEMLRCLGFRMSKWEVGNGSKDSPGSTRPISNIWSSAISRARTGDADLFNLVVECFHGVAR